jgi:hypothetical protein
MIIIIIINSIRTYLRANLTVQKQITELGLVRRKKQQNKNYRLYVVKIKAIPLTGLEGL